MARSVHLVGYMEIDGKYYHSDIMTKSNVMSFSMSESLDYSKFYTPCSVVNPVFKITGFLEPSPITIGSVSMTHEDLANRLEYPYTTSPRLYLMAFDATAPVACLQLKKSMTKRKDGSYEIECYCGEPSLVGEYFGASKYITFPSSYQQNSYSLSSLLSVVNERFPHVLNANINDTDISATLGTVSAPVDLKVSTSKGTSSVEYTLMDALRIVCGFTCTFASCGIGYSTDSDGNRLYYGTQYLNYPKISRYGLSNAINAISIDSVTGVSSRPLYLDGYSSEFETSFQHYIDDIRVKYWYYSSNEGAWKDETMYIGSWSGDKEYTISTSNYIYLWTSGVGISDLSNNATLNRLAYNIANLCSGEFSNTKRLAPCTYTSASDIHWTLDRVTDKWFTPGTFKTLPTFDFHAGDIIKANIDGELKYIIATSVTTTDSNTIITSEEEKRGSDSTFAINEST